MRLALTLVAAVLLSGCGLLADSGTVYAVPAKEARATLLLTEPPMFLFGNEAAKARVSRDADGTVRWLLVDKLGTGMLTLVAKTEEVDAASTRIIVSLEPPPGGLHDQVAKGLADNSTIVAFYKAAMEEQIAAKFQNREFDMAVIQDEMMAAAFANVGNIADSMDEAAKESEERGQASRQTYGADGEAWRDDTTESSDESAYGEPMDTGVAAEEW